MKVEVNGNLSTCPECKAALIVINGSMTGRITVWNRGSVTMVTPHTDDCVTGDRTERMLDPEPAPHCICVHFTDTGGYRIADLCCPIHGVKGSEPGDGQWEDE